MLNTLSIVVFLLSVPVHAKETNSARLSKIKVLKRIAFASCNQQDRPQKLWKEIAKQNPDLFIWGGDIVYGDGPDPHYLQSAYKKLESSTEYQTFKAKFPIIGTWDDHDYGLNDGGYSHSFKTKAQELLLNFLEEPSHSPRRKQKGVHTQYVFGKDDQKVKIILLDSRYFKDQERNSILGKEQWAWLQQELADHSVSLFIVVSSISVLSPKTPASEEWMDYPKERQRLTSLLKKTKTPYLFLAGDKHFSDIITEEGELEFLSSGMTHNVASFLHPWIVKKYPQPVFEKNFGIIDLKLSTDSINLSISILGENDRIYRTKKLSWKRASSNQSWIEAK